MSNWRTPVGPPERGRFWCVHASRGVYEWLVHPEDGQQMLDTPAYLDGEPATVTKICEWPHVGRWHIQVSVPEVNTGWIDAAVT